MQNACLDSNFGIAKFESKLRSNKAFACRYVSTHTVKILKHLAGRSPLKQLQLNANHAQSDSQIVALAMDTGL